MEELKPKELRLALKMTNPRSLLPEDRRLQGDAVSVGAVIGLHALDQLGPRRDHRRRRLVHLEGCDAALREGPDQLLLVFTMGEFDGIATAGVARPPGGAAAGEAKRRAVLGHW